MDVKLLLLEKNTLCLAPCESRKRLLELISKSAAIGNEEDIFEALLARERLGSTAIGEGVAIPHCRYSDTKNTVGLLITLKKPIQFDAPDNNPVDVFFALITPEDANDEHLQMLASLAETFQKEDFRNHLREATTDEQLHALFSKEFS